MFYYIYDKETGEILKKFKTIMFEINPKRENAYESEEDADVGFYVVFDTKNYRIINPLEKKKIDVLIDIKNKFNNKMKELAAKYPETERDTWPIQQAEWSEWVKDPDNAKTPFVDSLAAARGIDRETLLERIGVKVTEIAALLGKKQAFEDQVAQAETLEDLEAISISFE